MSLHQRWQERGWWSQAQQKVPCDDGRGTGVSLLSPQPKVLGWMKVLGTDLGHPERSLKLCSLLGRS